jgi:hypothetical protein
MKTAIEGLFRRFDNQRADREIDEELSFHLELLTEALQQQDLSLAEARNAALKRFGNVEQIKEQCVEISRRNQPAIRALKSFLILVFLAGVLVRVFSTELNFTRMGDVLMAVGVLGRLLVYVRGLNPSSFVSKPEDSSQLVLTDKSQASFAVYDQRRRTPIERVFFDK